MFSKTFYVSKSVCERNERKQQKKEGKKMLLNQFIHGSKLLCTLFVSPSYDFLFFLACCFISHNFSRVVFLASLPS